MSDPKSADDPREGRIILRYWASARAAAGTDEDAVEVQGPMTLMELMQRARSMHDSRRFADVLLTCSVLVGDRPVATEDPAGVLVQAGQSVEFLPPFAGG